VSESKQDVRQERAACPLYTAIGVIEGRWKPMLCQRLARKAAGFGELHRAMPGISRKVLVEQLRQMEGDDLVVRYETGDRLGSVSTR
jgi:DNA-binding HxlR family transcriptional regulator